MFPLVRVAHQTVGLDYHGIRRRAGCALLVRVAQETHAPQLRYVVDLVTHTPLRAKGRVIFPVATCLRGCRRTLIGIGLRLTERREILEQIIPKQSAA